jgi:hypothetical protein
VGGNIVPIVKVKRSTQLEFGYGDIEVAPALLESEDIVGVICFFQREEAAPIGEHSEYATNKKVLIKETPVRMLFDRVESIDVLIWALEETKRFMIQGNLNPVEVL